MRLNSPSFCDSTAGMSGSASTSARTRAMAASATAPMAGKYLLCGRIDCMQRPDQTDIGVNWGAPRTFHAPATARTAPTAAATARSQRSNAFCSAVSTKPSAPRRSASTAWRWLSYRALVSFGCARGCKSHSQSHHRTSWSQARATHPAPPPVSPPRHLAQRHRQGYVSPHR